MSKVTVIYHKNCLDGLFAARVCYYKLKDTYKDEEIRFVAANYNDTPPEIVGQLVYIVDFSYPRETLIAMATRAEKVVVLDHHESARKNLTDLQHPNLEIHFDMERSGCGLAWVHFMGPEHPIPKAVAYVEDRDLWRFKLQDTKAVCAALYLEDFNHPDAPKGPVDYNTHELTEVGEVVLRYQEKLLDKLTAPENVRCYNFWGCSNVAFVNSPVMQSEIGDRLSKDHPFVVVHYENKEKQIFSLRSNKSNPDWVDVAEIAEHFGGGGHINAAGFTMDKHADKYDLFNQRP